MLRSEVMAEFSFRLTTVSTGAGAVGFISMTGPSKLVEKAIRRPDATWNGVKSELFLSLCLARACTYVHSFLINTLRNNCT